jgi:hypothetical protein
LQGLAVIGSGDDPLSQAVAAGTSAAVEWSATEYPDQTAAVLGVLEATGNAIDATITYVDDATGNKVSKRWSEIPEHTRNQIKGGAKIASIFVPAGSIKALKQLKTARKLPDAPTTRMISETRANHILHGDGTGGGHLWPGASGKSAFPQNWSSTKILDEINSIATNSSIPGRVQGNGRIVKEAIVDGINIRVVLDPPSKGGGVVTGFPTNVPRNPK